MNNMCIIMVIWWSFIWFNPTLGFNRSDTHLIRKTLVDLGPRGDPASHKLVKCPMSWIAQYLNGGHECIVVRISQPVTDPLSNPPWDASQNRHIGPATGNPTGDVGITAPVPSGNGLPDLGQL